MKTKKTFKRIAAAVAAVMMMCAVPVSMTNVQKVSAAYDITIKANEKDTANNISHTYNAYQVFSGDLSGTTLSNINWGSGVDTGKTINNKNLLDAVKAIDIGTAQAPNKLFATCTNAADIAKVLSDNNTNAALAKAFADVVSDYKSATISGTSGALSSNKYTISVTAAGYYLVEDSTNPSKSAMTRAILKVTGDTTEITPKMDYPTLDKSVRTSAEGVQTETWDNANTASIGDNVYYKLESEVPSTIADYNKYFFIVNDTLSDGLTLNYQSVKDTRNAGTDNKFTVTVGGKTLTDITDISKSNDNKYTDSTAYNNTGEYYYVIQDGQSFKLVFVNFKQYSAGEKITIKYSATLNSSAKLGTAVADANTNTAKLTYSSDPNFDYYGDPGNTNDHPRTNDDTTPQDESKEKPDEPNEPKSGDKDDPTTPQDESKDKEPTSDTPDDKVVTYSASLQITKIDGATDGDDKGKKLSGAKFKIYTDQAGNNEVLSEQTTDANGLAYFKGLGAGTYWLKETQAPAGYNILAAPVEVTIGAATPGLAECTWVGASADESGYVSMYTTEVKNNKGATLPGTGGIGTTIFYISGGVLVLGAGVVLITKKRMSLKDEK